MHAALKRMHQTTKMAEFTVGGGWMKKIRIDRHLVWMYLVEWAGASLRDICEPIMWMYLRLSPTIAYSTKQMTMLAHERLCFMKFTHYDTLRTQETIQITSRLQRISYLFCKKTCKIVAPCRSDKLTFCEPAMGSCDLEGHIQQAAISKRDVVVLVDGRVIMWPRRGRHSCRHSHSSNKERQVDKVSYPAFPAVDFIACGRDHVIALSKGRMYGLGENQNYQLMVNSPRKSSKHPRMSALAEVVAVGCAADYTLAIAGYRVCVLVESHAISCRKLVPIGNPAAIRCCRAGSLVLADGVLYSATLHGAFQKVITGEILSMGYGSSCLLVEVAGCFRSEEGNTVVAKRFSRAPFTWLRFQRDQQGRLSAPLQ